MSLDTAVRLTVAVWLAGGVLFAAAGLICLIHRMQVLAGDVRGWLVLRRTEAALSSQHQRAAGFWRHVEHHGLHERAGGTR